MAHYLAHVFLNQDFLHGKVIDLFQLDLITAGEKRIFISSLEARVIHFSILIGSPLQKSNQLTPTIGKEI
jgi:hypothetical protein